MWGGTRVASPPSAPSPTAATPGSTRLPIFLPAIFSALTPSRAAVISCARSIPAAPSSFSHSSSCRISDGGAINPASPLLPGGRGRGGFPVASASSRRRGEKPASPEFVDADGGDEDYDEWEDEEGEEEGDGPAMPFEEMRRWLRNKPAGFGHGKSYDTGIEDRLLEEMVQSRKAQVANIDMLKSGVEGQARAKKQQPWAPGVDQVAPNGARVRVRGLPRKRNIHRDLKLAFKRFPSIVNISPAVVGNKKTRDPVCKGLAFIDFDSDEAANKFVQTYSKQSVSFGRLQKEITCDVINTFHSSNSGLEISQRPTFTQQRLTDFQGESSTGPNPTRDVEEKDLVVLNEIGIGCGTEGNYKKITAEDQASSLLVDTIKDIGYSHENFLVSDERLALRNGEEAAESGSSKEKQKAQMVARKKSVKTKPDKAPKLSMPGSIARLKVKERAVLTGVLSKYGEPAVPAYSDKS